MVVYSCNLITRRLGEDILGAGDLGLNFFVGGDQLGCLWGARGRQVETGKVTELRVVS